MIAAIAVSLLAVAAFAIVLWRADILAISRRSVEFSTAGIGAMLDPGLNDDAKEAAVRRAGLRLIGTAGQLALMLALSLAAAGLPIFLADIAGLVPRQTVFALMLRLDYLVGISVLATIGIVVWRKLRPPAQVEDLPQEPVHNHYSEADRIFHYIAFASPAVLRGASRLEDRLVRGIPPAPAHPPIFVTALARAGTTAVLNALHDLPGIATHVYRQMPFLTAPLLWDRIAGGAKRNVPRRQRAHGDGLEIDLDTPEAFEEVVWKMFWARKYAGRSIELWGAADADPKAEAFFRRHMAKVVHAARGPAGGAAAEAVYCSKNNANIARLGVLPTMFPGCRIVIPVRRPEAHAHSLLRQHRNFVVLQSEDEFVRRYMGDIGHFEFGAIHKPFAFHGFDPGQYDPGKADYWLAYWIAAHREVLGRSEGVHFVMQDDLRERPRQAMASLCAAIGVDPGGIDFGAYFRPGEDSAAKHEFAPSLLREAAALHEELRAQAAQTLIAAA